MQVQTATRFILFSLLQLYAVVFAIAQPATVPSQLLNKLLTLNFTIPYNVTYNATSSSKTLPSDPSFEIIEASIMRLYDYGMPISRQDTVECLAQLLHRYFAHSDMCDFVEIEQRFTVGSVELYIIDPEPRQLLTWELLVVTQLLLLSWLAKYEFRTLTFAHWRLGDLVATGSLSSVGAE